MECVSKRNNIQITTSSNFTASVLLTVFPLCFLPTAAT